MAELINFSNFSLSSAKKQPPKVADDGEDNQSPMQVSLTAKRFREVDPAAALASARHEFGEHGGVNMSIEASATFTVMEAETMRRLFAGELGPDGDYFIYSRHFNPTVLNLGRQMAALEGTEAAYCTASGMSAITTVLLQLVGAGGHVVASQCLYGGTHALLSRFVSQFCKKTKKKEVFFQ
jgi:methionine-gamma-lyase